MERREGLAIVIFTSAEDDVVFPLVQRFDAEPGLRVAAVIFEVRRLALRPRLKRFVRQHGWSGLMRKGARAATSALRAVSPVRWLNRWAHPERPGPREEFERYCAERGISLSRVTDFHAPATLEEVRRLDPAVGVVYGTRILKETLFSIPRWGSLNIHSRKVPEYRGGGPIGFHEMLRGESEIGVTIHQVASDVDAGDVWSSAVLPIDARDVPESLTLKVRHIGRDLFVDAIRKVAAGERPIPQATLGAPGLYRAPSVAERRAFRRRFAERYRPAHPLTLKGVVQRALAGVFLYCGYVQVRNAWRRARGRCPGVIVNLHRVADNRGDHWMTIETTRFDRYLAFLERNYRVVSIEEMRALLARGANREHLVAITFDDGYKECASAAGAVLANRRMPASFYVCSGLVSGGSLEHDRVRGIAELPLMDASDIHSLVAHGFEVGSHGATHLDFSASPVSAVDHEIGASKRELERCTGVEISGLSVPFGSPAHCRPEVFAAARRHGYRYVLSHFDGVNFPGEDTFHLRRVRPPLGSVLLLHASVEGWRGVSGFFDQSPQRIRPEAVPSGATAGVR